MKTRTGYELFKADVRRLGRAVGDIGMGLLFGVAMVATVASLIFVAVSAAKAWTAHNRIDALTDHIAKLEAFHRQDQPLSETWGTTGRSMVYTNVHYSNLIWMSKP